MNELKIAIRTLLEQQIRSLVKETLAEMMTNGSPINSTVVNNSLKSCPIQKKNGAVVKMGQKWIAKENHPSHGKILEVWAVVDDRVETTVISPKFGSKKPMKNNRSMSVKNLTTWYELMDV